MAEITQTILDPDPEGRPGNCLQAAVASLLDLDLDDVPHFVEHQQGFCWMRCLRYFAAWHGWDVWRRNPDRDVAFGIATGPTVRGTHHAVVWRDGQMAWDPHPSRAGLIRVDDLWSFEPRSN